ncbi:MAG: ATP-binding protein [Burkholderiaceae bacterium]|nr:MAG: ATP-binding protein [Burkholderiaceae bacterium]TBR76849.1 MAG: ATP-binding protein [Burkholderiaceae bacterium]
MSVPNKIALDRYVGQERIQEEQQVTSRLRRMLLVNTRTSGNITSASINEVDPRGGASITGENAVGKTTTLELFPLFFGTLPSQITETVGGREPMLKFVLPMPYSAIVFEYQRGSDEEHDVRCAVLRRANNDHRPLYRFINRGFREEAFVRTDEQGRQIFCDDIQMADAYFAMGADCSRQLDIAEYRAVILGTEARTQDAKALRRMSADYGFGSRLTNLDRLVAAVAKERLDFKDFVRLAITIVQERLNAHGDAPSRQKITLRQSKDQIERWLRDRSALEAAFGMARDVELLREAIDLHGKAENVLRAVRLEVAPALKFRRERMTATQSSLKSAGAILGSYQTSSRETVLALMKAAGDAAGARDASAGRVHKENARRESLELSQVQGWALELDRAPQMQVDHQNLEASTRLMSGKSDGIVNRFTSLINDARNAARDAAQKLRSSKDQARDRAEREAETIRNAHEEQGKALDAEFSAIKDELDPQIQELVERHAKLEAQIEAAQPSQASKEALDTARIADREAAKCTLDATRAASDARAAWLKSIQDHKDAESAAVRAGGRVEEAERRLSEAQDRLVPPEGTLLGVLRASSDESWKSGLAKILDPALLARADLAPTPIPDADPDTAFGWQLDTSGIAQPAWADDEQLRQALAQAEATLSAAKKRLSEANDALQVIARTVQGKKKALDEAEGELSIAESRQDKARRDEEIAQAQCEGEVEDLKRSGAARLQESRKELSYLRAQMTTEEKRVKAARADAAAARDSKLSQHRAALDQAIESIEGQALEAESNGEVSAKSLETDRDNLLKAEGVDPVRLAEIRAQAATLAEQIRITLGRRPIVDLWHEWLNEGGQQILAGLEDAARSAQRQCLKAEALLKARQEDVKLEEARLAAEVDRLEKLEHSLKEEIDVLKRILSDNGLIETTSRAPDPNLSVEDLRTRLSQARSQEGESEEVVRRRHSPIRDQLIGRASSVADFVQRSLDALPVEMTLVGKASQLCSIHGDLARQVLPNVINDATTILNQVRQFRGVITRFEKEVDQFNNDLQRGLKVAQFHRINSLEVAIVSNFGDISLVKEINEIDKVGRAHDTSMAVNDQARLPDANTAGALTKFLELLRQDSTVELDLAAHVNLKGSVTVNGQTRPFSRPADLEHISSTGINAIILISLLVGMLNMIRGDNDIYIPWISDEVGKFDAGNFKGLIDTLRENRIDPVTASPKLTHAEFRHFARRYEFKDRGSIGLFLPSARLTRHANTVGPLLATETSSGADHET